MSGLLYAQARSAPDWTTQGFDAQRTSWMRVDPYISIDNLSKFQFIWKLKVDNESRHGNALTAPVALGNLMTFRGFKSLIFVGGSSNNVYGIDYDFGTMFWRTHHNYTAGAREYAGSPTCPGGMTVPLTRATPLTPPAQLAFFGFARAASSGEGRHRRARERRAAARGDRGAYRSARQSWRRWRRHASAAGAATAGGRAARGAARACARHTATGSRCDAASRTWRPRAQLRLQRCGRRPSARHHSRYWRSRARACQVPSRERNGDGLDLGRRLRLRRDVEHVRRRADGGVRHGFQGRDEAGDDVGVGWRGDRGPRAGHGRHGLRLDGRGSSEHANSIVALEAKTLKAAGLRHENRSVHLDAGRVHRRRSHVRRRDNGDEPVRAGCGVVGGADHAHRAAGQRALQQRRHRHVARCRGHALAARIGQRSEHRVRVRRATPLPSVGASRSSTRARP